VVGKNPLGATGGSGGTYPGGAGGSAAAGAVTSLAALATGGGGATGSGAGAGGGDITSAEYRAGVGNALPQFGHVASFPAASSGTVTPLMQCGQISRIVASRFS
jgi:hypothetical protein